MSPEANRIQYFAALSLAIVHVTGALNKAEKTGENDLVVACHEERGRLYKKRVELEELFENRTGGS